MFTYACNRLLHLVFQSLWERALNAEHGHVVAWPSAEFDLLFIAINIVVIMRFAFSLVGSWFCTVPHRTVDALFRSPYALVFVPGFQSCSAAVPYHLAWECLRVMLSGFHGQLCQVSVVILPF